MAAADKETPVEAEDLTVFVQSVMEQMVRAALDRHLHSTMTVVPL